MSNLSQKICCPTCQKKGTWVPDNTFRPFCSERCKLIDLGEWAAGKHSIPGEPAHQEDIDLLLKDGGQSDTK